MGFISAQSGDLYMDHGHSDSVILISLWGLIYSVQSTCTLGYNCNDIERCMNGQMSFGS